jgi:hypothetical protein
MYITIGTYNSFYMTVFCPDWIGTIQPGQQTSSLQTIISTNCYMYTVVPPDGGPGYAQNM